MGEEEKRPGSGTAAPGIPKKTILYAGVAVAVVILAIAISVQMDLLTNLPVPASGSASIARPVAAAVNTIAPAIVRTTVPIPPELRCPGGLSRCGSGCIDTHADIFNCGGCGKVCPAVPGADRTCAGSTCGFVCTHSYGQTFSDCNGVAADGCEVNLASDRSNCGTCGNTCAEGDTCFTSSCRKPLSGGGGQETVSPPPRGELK
jgi:hypothetical protein